MPIRNVLKKEVLPPKEQTGEPPDGIPEFETRNPAEITDTVTVENVPAAGGGFMQRILGE